LHRSRDPRGSEVVRHRVAPRAQLPSRSLQCSRDPARESTQGLGIRSLIVDVTAWSGGRANEISQNSNCKIANTVPGSAVLVLVQRLSAASRATLANAACARCQAWCSANVLNPFWRSTRRD
jgi:hypothetical protein